MGQRQGALVQNHMNVLGDPTGHVVVVGHACVGAGGTCGIDRVWGGDDFDHETGGERRQVRYDELLIRWGSGRGEWLGKLLEPECGHDGHDVGVVGEVEVDGLVEWEGRIHLVQRRVDVGASCREVIEMALKTGVNLFHEANTYATASGGAETVVAVELQIDAVLESLPLFVGEEIAPL